MRYSRTLLITGAALLGAVGCDYNREPAEPLYDAAPVESRPIEVTVHAAGVIEPKLTIEVKSKASGEILTIHGDTGDVIPAGTLLVEIDKRTPRNQLAEAEASLIAARARRTIAETQMERATTLHEAGTLTRAEYEQTQLEHANSQAQVVSAEVSVENARIALADTDVMAPITGTIIERQTEPGAVISSPTQGVSDGTVLLKMADLSSVQVRTRVDETDIGKIRTGMPARVTVSAYPNQPFEGEVLKIEPQAIVEQNVTMFAVLIELENREGLLMPGMNAEVEIQVADRDSVEVVPTMALRTEADIPATAAMLGMSEEALRSRLREAGAPFLNGSSPGGALSVGGRQMNLPDGVDPQEAADMFARARSGQLSAEDRARMQQLMQEMGGGRGGPPGGFGRGGAGGGGGPPGGFPEGGFPGGGDMAALFQGQGSSGRPASVTEYQFGGDYWVVVMRAGKPEPVPVRTGLTDLAYSELISGLEPGDEVLLLPSSSLFEQQDRLQQFISDRFSGGSPFQQGGGGGGGRGMPGWMR